MAPPKYVLALDQGTGSTRAILYDAGLKDVASAQLEHASARPHPGWVEQDPAAILFNAKKCIDDCLKSPAARALDISASSVAAIGITNQRETTVIWDNATGKPLHPAIVWNDGRTEETVEELKKTLSERRIRKLTGLPISTYFSAVKVAWLRANVPAVDKALEDGTALFGTIDTFLVWHLTGKKSFFTDVTNASRTLLMNVHTLDWDDKLLDMLNVPRAALPEIKSCADDFGELDCTILKGVPIAGLVGDQQAALIGQAGFAPGQGKSTYGTGAFLMVNVGETPRFSRHGLLTTPAYKLGPDAPCVYALEGSVAVAGAAVKWMKERVQLFKESSEVETLAREVDDTGDVYVVPAFAGLFAPRWRSDARGCVVGITEYTGKEHLARATLESVAFQVADVMRAVEADMGAGLGELRVDGGASRNDLLLEMQADVLGCEVVRPQDVETTARGAAIAAGLRVRFFESTEAVAKMGEEDRRFAPRIEEEDRKKKLHKWEMAVQRSLNWTRERTGLWKCVFDALEKAEERMENASAAMVLAHVGVAAAVGVLMAVGCARVLKM